MILNKVTQSTTPTGKTIKEIEIEDGEGKVALVVAVQNEKNAGWFANLVQGADVDGQIKEFNGKQYFHPPFKPRQTRSNAPISRESVKDDVSRAHIISDAMSRKEASIEKFTDKKEQNIIYMASVREAGNYMVSMTHIVSALDEEGYHAEFWKQQRRFYKEIYEDSTR